MGYGGEKRCLRYGVVLFMMFCILVIINTPRYILTPRQVSGWEMNVPREASVYIVPGNETSLINGANICKQGVSIMVVVCSAPTNFYQRSAIRRTWGSHNISSVHVAFLLGVPTNSSLQPRIEEENLEYGDIIQENFVDTYNNLTLKSLMMLKWVLKRCQVTDFLMKVDDDVYVNLTRISTMLSRSKPKHLLMGSLICRAKPILDSNNKWYNPRYMYGSNVYPPYLSGTSYVMSKDVVNILYHTALSTKLIHLEDVFLTGICAAKAGIKPRNHRGFTYQHIKHMCDPSLVTNHHFSPEELEALWKETPNCTAPTQRPNNNPCH